ncbi:MAG: aminotransferase class I/II-fold pyridoxal phosphate-dependent enzyme, partial [Planctomycetes bacterium]|nr:aminotransferase class I/II-fold pyridoxal phosphate-dependent enzyme [Planctomycetota bacterium]
MDPRLSPSWEDWIAAARADLTARRLWRRLRILTATDGLHGAIEGREVVLFSSNDYLGLASHPAVRAAAAEASARGGLGPRAAPLVCGYTEEHAALEADLAALTGAGSALLFATGYSANLSVLTALADEGTAIFSDELNHASIVDGCRLARARGAEVMVYRHADAGHLEELLRACAAPRRLVVTDSVFSMDGDLAPLADLADLRRRHGALLAVDEAHAFLVLGPHGGGLAEALVLVGEVDLRVGTLGKALGSQGGFVACSPALREHLVNR